jgi:hypothetical protein
LLDLRSLLDMTGVRGIMRNAWINEQSVVIRDDKIAEWHVNLRITFVLDD